MKMKTNIRMLKILLSKNNERLCSFNLFFRTSNQIGTTLALKFSFTYRSQQHIVAENLWKTVKINIQSEWLLSFSNYIFEGLFFFTLFNMFSIYWFNVKKK